MNGWMAWLAGGVGLKEGVRGVWHGMAWHSMGHSAGRKQTFGLRNAFREIDMIGYDRTNDASRGEYC